MKQKNLIIGVALFAVMAFITYAYVLPIIKQSNFEVTGEQSNSQLVTCNIVIKNPAGIPIVKDGDLIIEGMNCQRTFVRNCIGTFGIFSDKGTVALKGNGGSGSAANVDINEGSSNVVQLKWCGSKMTQKVSTVLSDINGNQLYVKDYILI